MQELTPRQIVEELDKYIVGQKDAKRAIAVAIRNRWRRQQVEGDMREEIGPKNMMMIGPTGVGKTEIARRLATLTGAPFIKVDATKYTEVGYYGRDVESMGRELIENAAGIVRSEERSKISEAAKQAAEKRLIELLTAKFEKEKRDLSEFDDAAKVCEEVDVVESAVSDVNLNKNESEVVEAEIVEEEEEDESNDSKSDEDLDPATRIEEYLKKMYGDSIESVKAVHFDPSNPAASFREMLNVFSSAVQSRQDASKEAEKKEEKHSSDSEKKKDKTSKKALREQVENLLALGKLDEETISYVEERRITPVVMGGVGMEAMADDIQNMLENISPKKRSKRELSVADARRIFVEQESERLLDKDKINERAVKLAENMGIIFIDEIDKIVGSEGGRGADVSRQGVQRDLLPIVEGTTLQTKYGLFSTEHVLFIAAGAFHRVKPSDLTPELQGRFPIRVELSDLKKEDFVRILTEPKSALTKQYSALMKTEGVELVFKDDAIETIAEYAAEANLTTQNIGARRLCTIMELLLEDLNFDAAEMESGRVEIDSEYVRSKIEKVIRDEDLSKFVL